MTTMPAIFVGHGNPMNALVRNVYTSGWAELGRTVSRPRAILCISAHWYIRHSAVTGCRAPQTIHDFGGFPKELSAVGYPAVGSLDLAHRIKDLLAPVPVETDKSWGLDHGAWSVLIHMYPKADIPVVQLGIDQTQLPSFHYELGRRLQPLREEGVLILGSGNLVHNLHSYAWGCSDVEAHDWALRFENRVRDLLLAGDIAPLAVYEALGKDARLAVPTPDHYLPLLYVLGSRHDKEPISFPVQGIDGGSVSMLAVRCG